jgi:hypothetical protein
MTLEQLLALRPHQFYLERPPLDQLLTDSLYYPDCGMDGEIIRFCNTHFGQTGICSFVLADSNVTEAQFLDGMDSFSHYKIWATRICHEAEISDMPAALHPTHSHFARWTVYQRMPEYGAEMGPGRFSLLFLGGARVSADGVFNDLYGSRVITPKAVVGDWRFNDDNDPYTVAVYGGVPPEYVFYKSQNEEDELDMVPMLYDFESETDVHFAPGGRGNVTIWHISPESDDRY